MFNSNILRICSHSRVATHAFRYTETEGSKKHWMVKVACESCLEEKKQAMLGAKFPYDLQEIKYTDNAELELGELVRLINRKTKKTPATTPDAVWINARIGHVGELRLPVLLDLNGKADGRE